MGSPSIFHEYSMVTPWIPHGDSMDILWISHGYAMGLTLIFHACSVISHGCSMNIPFILHCVPLIFHLCSNDIPWMFDRYSMGVPCIMQYCEHVELVEVRCRRRLVNETKIKLYKLIEGAKVSGTLV